MIEQVQRELAMIERPDKSPGEKPHKGSKDDCTKLSQNTTLFRCVIASLKEGVSVSPSVRPSVPKELKSQKRAILSKVRVKDGIENECMTNQATVKSPGTIISASSSTKTSKISVEVPARQRTHLWSELCSTCCFREWSTG